MAYEKSISKLSRLECHGPKKEIEKLKLFLSPLGTVFYAIDDFAAYKPSPMDPDTCVSLHPYFKGNGQKKNKTWWDLTSRI
jgi:hypothetical protein